MTNMKEPLRYRIVCLINSFLLRRNLVFTASVYQLEKGRDLDIQPHSFDFFRLAFMKHVAEEAEAKRLPGSVAELGVYRGRVSALLNGWFPGRKMYLFDTFEGFDDRDLEVEIVEQLSSGKREFQMASVEQVLSIMPYPNNCIVRKGYFPETAQGVDDEFVLVSLDADLYNPTYEGLKYFYKRMVKGGVIVVHDYNTKKFEGVKKAVRNFSNEFRIPYMPLPDTAGSVVFLKGG